MSDFGNRYDIEQTLVELDEAITGFEAAHQAYHNQLGDRNERYLRPILGQAPDLLDEVQSVVLK